MPVLDKTGVFNPPARLEMVTVLDKSGWKLDALRSGWIWHKPAAPQYPPHCPDKTRIQPSGRNILVSTWLYLHKLRRLYSVRSSSGTTGSLSTTRGLQESLSYP